ncbi:hypothetical protein SUNDANCE_161 [Brevibacillus phage Sundance]|nr:hypothetical protein AVT09_gp161 [Brevibacillus phage Sundance]ALA47977.1 hypothetical protein SUNDANCE_161 [Brevibacillus phage Sundance]
MKIKREEKGIMGNRIWEEVIEELNIISFFREVDTE